MSSSSSTTKLLPSPTSDTAQLAFVSSPSCSEAASARRPCRMSSWVVAAGKDS